MVLSGLLEAEGYQVAEASDGIAALDRLRTSPVPLVVLLDWLMPGLDGVGLLRTRGIVTPSIQEHTYLLMTAATERLPSILPDLPADLTVSVLGKPFDIEEMLLQVEEAATHLYSKPPRK